MAWTYPAAILLIIAALRGGTGGTLADAAFYESIRRAIGPKAERSLTMADVPAPDPRVAAAATPPAVDDPAKAIEPPGDRSRARSSARPCARPCKGRARH
jgi:hypothetical protein